MSYPKYAKNNIRRSNYRRNLRIRKAYAAEQAKKSKMLLAYEYLMPKLSYGVSQTYIFFISCICFFLPRIEVKYYKYPKYDDPRYCEKEILYMKVLRNKTPMDICRIIDKIEKADKKYEYYSVWFIVLVSV